MKTIYLKVEIEDDAKIQCVMTYRFVKGSPDGFAVHGTAEYTEIEIPAEEEIKKESLKYFEKDNDNDSLFRIGAKWAIKQITG
jgi:hypothetical protein